MSFSPSFVTSQVLGYPSVVNFLDNSSGSNGAITGRRIYMQTSAGIFLVPTGTSTDYTVWALANTTTAVDALDMDYGLRVVVEWVDVSGTAIYSSTQILGFTLYNEQFSYGLVQALTGNPALINDSPYFKNMGDLRTEIDGGNQAIIFAADIFSAQQCYDRATQLRLNSTYSFNINS